MKKYALKNISQIKFVDGNVEIKYDDGAVFKFKENLKYEKGDGSQSVACLGP